MANLLKTMQQNRTFSHRQAPRTASSGRGKAAKKTERQYKLGGFHSAMNFAFLGG
jgi:hypothetical protein